MFTGARSAADAVHEQVGGHAASREQWEVLRVPPAWQPPSHHPQQPQQLPQVLLAPYRPISGRRACCRPRLAPRRRRMHRVGGRRSGRGGHRPWAAAACCWAARRHMDCPVALRPVAWGVGLRGPAPGGSTIPLCGALQRWPCCRCGQRWRGRRNPASLACCGWRQLRRLGRGRCLPGCSGAGWARPAGRDDGEPAPPPPRSCP
jgi:hypothetical protein